MCENTEKETLEVRGRALTDCLRSHVDKQAHDRLRKAIDDALYLIEDSRGNLRPDHLQAVRAVLAVALDGKDAPDLVEVSHPETGEPVFIPADQDEREEWSRG